MGPFGWGGSPRSADGPRLQSGVGESFAEHVSHSGAFALESAAGNRPQTRSLFISMDSVCPRACCEIRSL